MKNNFSTFQLFNLSTCAGVAVAAMFAATANASHISETMTLKTGGALAANAVTGAFAVGDIADIAGRVHDGLTETVKYSPSEKLTLPEIPFRL